MLNAPSLRCQQRTWLAGVENNIDVNRTKDKKKRKEMERKKQTSKSNE